MRDERALAHAAGELVRVLPERGLPHPAAPPRGAPWRASLAVAAGRGRWPERLLDLEADVPDRVEVLHRVLRHQADAAAADARSRGLRWREMSSPSNRIWPPVTRPLPGSRLMIACAVVDLPEPDSPTIASVSPGMIVRSTPRTAGTRPSAGLESDLEVLDLEQRASSACRLRGCRLSASWRLHRSRLRVERVAQGVAEHDEAQHGDRQRDRRIEQGHRAGAQAIWAALMSLPQDMMSAAGRRPGTTASPRP